jgi:broad-specificity NMP kinase
MKLIVIYGPPGVGKLTVAKELASITGYRLFHNHLTVELVGSVFEHGSPVYRKLVVKYRTELLEAAAKAGISGVIFTFIYRDNASTNRVLRSASTRLAKSGVKSHFVRLYCDENELYKRLAKAARKKYTKITSVKVLQREYRGYELFAAVPFVKSLGIDNTHLSPRKAALMIARHYHLKTGR